MGTTLGGFQDLVQGAVDSIDFINGEQIQLLLLLLLLLRLLIGFPFSVSGRDELLQTMKNDLDHILRLILTRGYGEFAGPPLQALLAFWNSL